jgi:phospholipase/lecithinase/hemolysin
MSDARFSRLYFFGDSLTDVGVMHGLTSRNLIVTVPTPDSGYSKSFTNGEVYAEIMVDRLDLASVNLAVGGAKAVGVQTFASFVDARVGAQLPPGAIYQDDADSAPLGFDINLGGQAARFVADKKPVPKDAAAAFFAGLNDYAEFTPTSPDTALAEGTALVKAVVASNVSSAAAAVGEGVSTILFYTMPSFRFFPLSGLRSDAELALGDTMVAAHNSGLALGAETLRKLGAEVEFLDTARISAEIKADPATFGFRANLFAQPALLGTGGNPTLIEQPDGSYRAVFPPNPAVKGVDPDQLAFWDFVHPTTALHEVWGIFSARSLDSETLFFGDAADMIAGTAGRDLVLAGGGDDRVRTAGGRDAVFAGLGDDTVRGGLGGDAVAGGSGDDWIAGGDGADALADGAGRDRVWGGRGGDLLLDGAGFDLLEGGDGRDAFVFVDATLKGGALRGNGGVFRGGDGRDTAYLVLDAVTADTLDASGHNRGLLDKLGLALRGIEDVVILDPDELPDAIKTRAPLGEAELWGLI